MLVEKIAYEANMEWLMVNATHGRAHAQSAGVRHKKAG